METIGKIFRQRDRIPCFLTVTAQALGYDQPVDVCTCRQSDAASAIPHQYATPGRPMRSHPDMSDASALIAVTHGPRLLPPRKYASELAFAFLANVTPIIMTAAI